MIPEEPMDPRTMLDALPDDAMLPVRWIRENLDPLSPRKPKVLTISEAVERWSYSRETWRQAAAEGEIAEAWQDTEGGTWRLPYEGCERYVARRREGSRRRGRRGPRGPDAWYRDGRLPHAS